MEKVLSTMSQIALVVQLKFQKRKITSFEVSGQAQNVAYDRDDHYTQAGDLYRLLSADEKTRLVANLVDALSPVAYDEIKLRQISHFYKADPEYGTRVAEGLGLAVPQQA